MDRTQQLTSRSSLPWLPVILVGVLLLAAERGDALEATVVLSQDCHYLLLDSPEGQMLVKMLEGEQPQVGDQLQGDFAERTSTTLKVRRTGANLRVWVNLIDRSTTHALTLFSQYCNAA